MSAALHAGKSQKNSKSMTENSSLDHKHEISNLEQVTSVWNVSLSAVINLW